MLLQELFERQFAHARWADEKLLEKLAEPAVPDRARRLMAHYLSTFHVWFERTQTDAISDPIWPEPKGFDYAGALERAYAEMAQLVREYAPDYELTFTYSNSRGQTYTSRLADVIQHTLLHGHYHRGQVNQLLRQAGLEPPVLDYIFYIREL